MRKSIKNTHHVNHFNQGFTLIEMMVVVVIVAIFATIAIPSYQHYVRRANVAQAQQEMEKLAEQLERYKSRNFSFKGFNAAYLYANNSMFNAPTQTLNLNSKYTIELVDSISEDPPKTPIYLNAPSAEGQGWAIKAESEDEQNFSLLLTSSGIHCKNLTKANISYSSCGDIGAEEW